MNRSRISCEDASAWAAGTWWVQCFLHILSTPTNLCTALWALRGCTEQHTHTLVTSVSSACRSSTRLGQARRHSQILYHYKMSSQSSCAPIRLEDEMHPGKPCQSITILNLWWKSWLIPFLTLSQLIPLLLPTDVVSPSKNWFWCRRTQKIAKKNIFF